jgi:type II secretory pathway pseudopilin PulG
MIKLKTNKLTKLQDNEAAHGFTLVETLVGVFIFLVIAISLYQAYLSILHLTQAARLKGLAALVANQQLEVAHNLPYDSVGIISGLPSGLIPHLQTITASGIDFQITTTVRNIDDPFDGVIGGNPNDSSPADNKLVEVLVACATCRDFTPFEVTTTIAPKNLETTSGNGALFIDVFDANGDPVPQANVHILNSQVNPDIIIDDVTNANGELQLVDVPPGNFAYEISVAKTGYSSAQTYLIDPEVNPNPLPPHSTVAVGQVTQISFAIDQVSQFEVKSITNLCAPVPNLTFNLKGAKTIGTSPTMLKYDNNFTTNSAGEKTISNLEWDSYTFTPSSASYDLAGTIPLLPIALSPGATQNVALVMAPLNPKALLVIVKDGGMGLPLSGVNVALSKTGFDQSLITDRGFLRQTDWSGGAGQVEYTDPTKFFASDSNNNVDYATQAGEVKLKQIGNYQTPGWLESSIFDTGGSQASYYNLSWSPINQPLETGSDSVKFQIAATSSLPATFTYLGPDGTPDTYYTLADTNLNSVNNNKRYVRYKLFLTTADQAFTPSISDISITFGSECLPYGQVFFNGLATGTYSLEITKTGYQPYNNDNVQITSGWQTLEVILTP